jgi:hypothetical protein
MRAAIAIASAVAALAAAAPAAGAVPYEERWERAAERARFKAVPGLAALAGLRPVRSQDGAPIRGTYDTFEPDEPPCRAVTDRYVARQVAATFGRSSDGAQLSYSFAGKVQKPCRPPEPDDLRGTRVLGRAEVLGKRVQVATFPLRSGQVGYRLRGRIRGHRLYVQINYPEDPGDAEIRRIAAAIRWVRP